MRGRFRRRCFEDRFPNPFEISQHLIIPEAQDAIAVIGQPTIPNSVAFVCCMLTPIHLDYEPLLSANEVDDVGADWLLSNELETG